MTILDMAITVLLVLLVVGLWGMAFERLMKQDKQANKDAKCPPHDWRPVYRKPRATDQIPVDGEVFDGLQCKKCDRRPGGFSNGESWTLPTSITPP